MNQAPVRKQHARETPQCDNGCAPTFLQWVVYKGTTLRVMKQNWSGAFKRTWSGVLRCADCGEDVYVVNMPDDVKQKLEQAIEAGLEDMTRLREHFDKESEERRIAFQAYLEETGRG